ncbi:MAG: hypothetical protein K2M15_01275 [Oscillospiraceae bacterium]|nr:hypothetical protein [Oscillospiraceae bacterium]MDE7172192.1 hypothetical protein [Oscillospiraceae bacterium]
MGISNKILALRDSGFIIEQFGDNYGIAFPKGKADEWEQFISQCLEAGYWNEYLSDEGVIFLFHLEDGLKRYVVKDYRNDEVLSLCEKLCERKFNSLKDMLRENHYYCDKMDR